MSAFPAALFLKSNSIFIKNLLLKGVFLFAILFCRRFYDIMSAEGFMTRTIEDLQYKGLKIIQEDGLFHFGTDAVLLAGFCDVKKTDTVVDLGTGTGIIPLLLSKRTGARVIGIELQKEVFELARQNVELNGLEGKVNIINADLRTLELKEERVTAVVCNPPYEKVGSGRQNIGESIKLARHEICCTLEDAVSCAARLLGTGGKLFMIHRSQRAAELISVMSAHKLEPKVLTPICAREGADPRYVLVAAKKDAKPGLKFNYPLVIHDKNGEYTQQMDKIYHREKENE